MITVLVAGVAGAAVMATGVLADPGGKRGQDRGHGARGGQGAQGAMMLLRAADLNDDKQITRAEVRGLREEMFAWMDRTGDGVLNSADQSPLRQRLAAKALAEGREPGERSGRRGGDRGERGMMGASDADGDGAISLAEFVNADAPLFERLDANQDDVITGAEIDAAMAERRAKRAWWRDDSSAQ